MCNHTQVASKTQHITHMIAGVQVPMRADNGYLNISALASAYYETTGRRRDPHNWVNNKRTQESVEHLSTMTGIPVVELIQRVMGGNDPEKRGTWIHPHLAVRFAIWLSDEFGYQVESIVEKWQRGLTTQSTEFQSKMLEHAQLNKELMAIFCIDGNMQTLALNNAMRKKFGVNLLETWDMDGGLKAQKQEQLYTVTEIAQKLGVSRTGINPILVKLGLQTSERDHKDQIKYKLTDKGREHGIYLDVGKQRSDGTPIRQLKWYESVIDEIKNHLESQFVTA